MTMTAPDFLENLSMADCLAQKFARLFPGKEPNAKFRQYGRGYVIAGLRWLWRNGDADNRTSIAMRIALWRDRPSDYVDRLGRRIRDRERNRKGGE